MKKLFIASLFFLVALATSEAQTLLPAYQGVTQFITVTGRYCNQGIGGCRIIASGAQYHQLSWNVSGTLSACTLQVDSSTDGVTWNSGDILSSRSCTSNGNATSTALTVNYVSINITAITPVSTASLSVNLTGYANNPAGTGGTVTAVTGGAPIASSGGTTPNITCPTCAIGPGASTANHIAEFSGTDGLTLKDGGVAGTGTVTNTAGALTAGQVMIGNGSADSKVDTALSTDGAGSVTDAQGTITTSKPLLSHTVTLNASGVAFTNWIDNLTCTAAATGTIAKEFGVGGTTWQYIFNGANCTNPQFLNPDGTAAHPAVGFTGAPTTGYHRSGTNFVFDIAGVAIGSVNSSTGYEVATGDWFCFSGSSDPTAACDTVMSRGAAKAFAFGSNGDETAFIRGADACRLTSDITLTVNTAITVCSWTFPVSYQKTWAWQCQVPWILSAGTGTNTLAISVNYAQTPNSTTNGSAEIKTTNTNTATESTVPISASGSTTLLTSPTLTPTATIFMSSTSGTIAANATSGIFSIQYTMAGTTATALAKAGGNCWLF